MRRQPKSRRTISLVGLASLVFLFGLGGGLAALQRNRETPDLILLGGKIYTLNPAQPWAEAIAVRGDSILAVGSDQDVLRLSGRGTRRFDLGRRLVLPGFIDSHIHFLSGSLALSQLDLAGASTVRRSHFLGKYGGTQSRGSHPQHA